MKAVEIRAVQGARVGRMAKLGKGWTEGMLLTHDK